MPKVTPKFTPGPWVWTRYKAHGVWFAQLLTQSDHPPLNDRLVTAMREDLAQFPYAITTANTKLIATAPELLAACKAQHAAMDVLFAMLSEAKPGFFPSESGMPWNVMLQGNLAIAKAEEVDHA